MQFPNKQKKLNAAHGYSLNVVLLVRLIITQIYSEITLLYRKLGNFSKNLCYFHLFTSET